MRNRRVWVTGASGLAGSAVVRSLRAAGYEHIITTSHDAVDLEKAEDVDTLLRSTRVDAIVHCAGHVGGVLAHLRHPTEYGMRNAQMVTSLLQTALEHEIPKLIYLGSVCIYPRSAPSPTAEHHLMTGPLEPSNAPYATAKILGITLCAAISHEYGLDWLSLQPSNLYGPGDRFADPENAHVVPAMMHKMHWAKVRGADQLKLPGTGSAMREFLHADDLGDAVVHVLENVKAADVPDRLLNVGSGEVLSIGQLALLLSGVVGYDRQVVFDHHHSDGAPLRLSDCERIRRLGWQPKRFMRAPGVLRDIYESVSDWGSPTAG